MRALVTGGGGFVGGAIVRILRGRGEAVRSFARGDYPALRARGVEVVRGDLTDAAAVRAAARGVDVVFHVAAKAGVWGTDASFHDANVVGTRHVIDACRAAGVPRLVFTSSPSVVFGDGPLEGVDESAPYPARYLAAYPRTKAEAERMVLAANDGDLATVALRPHLVWGPGDPHLVPRIVARARAGRLRHVGDGRARVDSTYIDNAAEAHVAACDGLAVGSTCAGKAYFVSNGEPVEIASLVNRIVGAAGLPLITRHVPAHLAYAAGAAAEIVYRALGREEEPPMTRFVAKQLSVAHWFDIGAARRDFGWKPRVSIDQGMEQLARWLHEAA